MKIFQKGLAFMFLHAVENQSIDGLCFDPFFTFAKGLFAYLVLNSNSWEFIVEWGLSKEN